MTSISGGGVEHLKSVIRIKKSIGQLAGVSVVVMVIGGNDLSRRDSRTGIITQGYSAKVMREKLQELVRWTLEELPEASVRMMDIIPRSSAGWFTGGVRQISQQMECEKEGRHSHVACWRSFVVEIEKKDRSGKERFQLRRELYGEDGVHLSELGRSFVERVLRWQMEVVPEGVEFKMKERLGEKTVELRACIKF